MKTRRQAKILEIISSKEVETQEQLLQELLKGGFVTTQATVSRDIKELRVVKELSPSGSYRYATSLQENAATFSGRLHKIFRECVTSVDCAQNMVVIRTLPGLANGAGSAVCEGTVFLVDEWNTVFRKHEVNGSSGRVFSSVG